MTRDRYTLIAGRTIKKNGRDFAYLGNNGGSPTELDKFVRDIVDLMNAVESLSEKRGTLLTAKDLENILGPAEASEVEETDDPDDIYGDDETRQAMKFAEEGRCPHGMFTTGAGACPECEYLGFDKAWEKYWRENEL